MIIGSDDHIIAMSALRKDWDPLLGEIYRKEKKKEKVMLYFGDNSSVLLLKLIEIHLIKLAFLFFLFFFFCYVEKLSASGSFFDTDMATCDWSFRI